jgi:HK97 family phage portal protein
MGILDRLLSRSGRAFYYYGGGYGVQVANLDTAALYRTQPNLRTVVSFLADNAAMIPIKVYERRGDDDRPRVLDSPAALLLQRPNSDTTPYEFKRAVYSDLLLYDQCICLVLPDTDAPSGWQIRQVPRPWVVGFRGDWVFSPDALIISHNGLSVEVPRERFIMFHGYNPSDPFTACTPVEALKDLLHEQVESNQFRRQMWQRGGRFNAYIARPKDVEEWTDEAFNRFKRTWDASWAGDNAASGGSMPILEDGMEIKQVQFNSRDAQWSEAKKLGREDVAGVYHVNPALIWPGSGQTYASAKDNARALYNETLAPRLMQVCDRLNQFLLPMVGEPPRHYVAYDITIKTEGTFEEKISALQAATGAPFLSRNEARARLDLPAIEGGDELITPLNVLAGGLSSPYDTDPTVERYNSLTAETKSRGELEAPRRYKAAPDDADAEAIAEVLREFFEHQRDVILPKLGAAEKRGGIKAEEWWDADRWNDELTRKLTPVAIRQATRHARRTLEALEVPDTYSEQRTEAYIESMSRRRAEMINDKTRDELEAVSDWDGDEDADRATYAGVFDLAASDRTESGSSAFATALAGWAAMEAVRQCAAGSGATKTWIVTSGNPRPSHAMMDGETVPYDKPFSNGAEWPGDAGALDAADVANCQCQVEITIG